MIQLVITQPWVEDDDFIHVLLVISFIEQAAIQLESCVCGEERIL